METDLRSEWLAIEPRLRRRQSHQSLHALYVEIAPLVGRLQGRISDLAASGVAKGQMDQAAKSFEHLRFSYRKVGLDIRLASEGAMVVGLQSVAQSALETLDILDRLG